jgi:Alanine-zipper, major outer membrane lipoprotein
MIPVRNALLALIPLVAVGACTTLSDADRAQLNAATQTANEAKQLATQALTTAQAAQTTAQAAQASASQAAADAKAANEKADRIFQRSLRK